MGPAGWRIGRIARGGAPEAGVSPNRLLLDFGGPQSSVRSPSGSGKLTGRSRVGPTHGPLGSAAVVRTLLTLWVLLWTDRGVPAAATAVTASRRHGRRRRDHPHRLLRGVRPPARHLHPGPRPRARHPPHSSNPGPGCPPGAGAGQPGNLPPGGKRHVQSEQGTAARARVLLPGSGRRQPPPPRRSPTPPSGWITDSYAPPAPRDPPGPRGHLAHWLAGEGPGSTWRWPWLDASGSRLIARASQPAPGRSPATNTGG
jgi:hypothetical protein